MDILDLVVLALILIAAIRGLRLGAVAQVLTFGGFLLGLGAGVALVLLLEPGIHGQLAKTFSALALLLVPATLFAGLGRQAGSRLGRVLLRVRGAHRIDSTVGAVLSVSGTLVVCWLFASVLINTPITGLSQQIQRSAILRGVQSVLPPVPDHFATVERYLAQSGFPQVLVNVLPQPIGPVQLPDKLAVEQAVALDARSTVKVVANGCPGVVQEGSGFVTVGDLVVTNAHVVAGTTTITVQAPGGVAVTAKPVLFDPNLDLAVLKPDAGLPVKRLTLSPVDAERGTGAVVLGYPGGGPLTDGGAAIVSRFEAQGRDIYDSALTVRTVYQIEAIVRQGNSGGPLIGLTGLVLGVVFSRSASDPTVGYALASPAVLAEVDRVVQSTTFVGTGTCIN